MDKLTLQESSTDELRTALSGIMGEIDDIIKQHEAELEKARAGKLHAEHLVVIQRDLAQDMCRASSEFEILSRALDSLLMVNGYDCGGAYLMKDGALRLQCHRNVSDDLLAEVSVFHPGSTQYRMAIKGRPVFRSYDDLVAADADDIRLSEGLKGIAVIPIMDRCKVMGCFTVASHEEAEVDDPALDSLISIVGYVGESLARERNAHLCKEARIQFEILAEAATDGIAILDDLEIVRCNKSFGTLVGVAEAGLIGRSILEFIDSEHHATYLEHQRHENGDPFEINLLRGDSPSIAVLAELQYLHHRNGYNSCVVLLAHERK